MLAAQVRDVADVEFEDPESRDKLHGPGPIRPTFDPSRPTSSGSMASEVVFEGGDVSAEDTLNEVRAKTMCAPWARNPQTDNF